MFNNTNRSQYNLYRVFAAFLKFLSDSHGPNVFFVRSRLEEEIVLAAHEAHG